MGNGVFGAKTAVFAMLRFALVLRALATDWLTVFFAAQISRYILIFFEKMEVVCDLPVATGLQSVRLK